jgi:very-short-patch-repair endonuclease
LSPPTISKASPTRTPQPCAPRWGASTNLAPRREAERRLLALIRAAELPHPQTNATANGYEVDALWPPQRLVVEMDSWAFHSSRQAFERGRLKDARLQAGGYRVLRVTWRQITHTPEALVARLATALAGR